MVFDEKMIKAIENLVQEVRKENNIINEIIRDDVFSILQDCKCTVLYYPLDGEEVDGCDGCHLVKYANNKKVQLVFINTNNTRERQAFSAAHELGHVWRVDENIKKAFPDREINEEEVINRFAAELLMPNELFQEVINEQLRKMNYKGPKMDIKTMIRLIAYLMNYFFVPYKAVVFRFNEVGRLDKKYNKGILKYKDSKFLQEVINTEQYTRLGLVNRMKSMDNLQEYIFRAENEGLISLQKAENIRNEFGIETVDTTDNSMIEF